MKSPKAFTLIELLIVVAIIAILAAIAVPNFLEAQVRSKVSRSKADMRTLATAIESYFVDYGVGPSDTGGLHNNVRRPYGINSPAANFTIGYDLTTPIAYLSSTAALLDVFKIGRGDIGGATDGRQFYNFASWRLRYKSDPTFAAYSTLAGRDGEWIVFGAGPDRYTNNNSTTKQDFGITARIPMRISYDPTNGTISRGDIYRSQKYGDGVFEMVLID